jgi:hypothetical protein
MLQSDDWKYRDICWIDLESLLDAHFDGSRLTIPDDC